MMELDREEQRAAEEYEKLRLCLLFFCQRKIAVLQHFCNKLLRLIEIISKDSTFELRNKK